MTDGEQKWIETNNQVCAFLRQAHDILALSSLPPQRTWVGMTDEEKEKFVVAYYPSSWDRKTAIALMNNYEAYLKEKNT